MFLFLTTAAALAQTAPTHLDLHADVERPELGEERVQAARGRVRIGAALAAAPAHVFEHAVRAARTEVPRVVLLVPSLFPLEGPRTQDVDPSSAIRAISWALL